ncbi:uncharacterized protein LOC133198367 [Saccostrea echinata]|uniref:uncharacterized protein LOC133198367 n=1 Tax=Saccostrea echinata TaxID=191078 RepID=UPI002A82A3D8|nr:uncharacterized protein LOC133198367 [Saccostrea echinata]
MEHEWDDFDVNYPEHVMKDIERLEKAYIEREQERARRLAKAKEKQTSSESGTTEGHQSAANETENGEHSSETGTSEGRQDAESESENGEPAGTTRKAPKLHSHRLSNPPSNPGPSSVSPHSEFPFLDNLPSTSSSHDSSHLVNNAPSTSSDPGPSSASQDSGSTDEDLDYDPAL